MAARRGLGKGLGALINDSAAADTPPEPKEIVQSVPIGSIRKNRLQPRHTFEEASLAELTESVRTRGVLQPLLVRAEGDEFELIAGERRLRAATEAGLTKVPVIVMVATDSDAMELALVENLQREDLNVLEEAQGYEVLAERFGMTQEQIAQKVGKARASVANTMRLLGLPAEVKRMVNDEALSAGHAKLLTGLALDQEQLLYARRVVDEGLSVRQLEKLLKRVRETPRKPRASRADIPGSHLSYLSDKLHSHFGTSVRLSPCRTYANGKKGKGSLEIDFYSNEELDRLLALLGIDVD